MATETLHRSSPWPLIAVVAGVALALLPVAAGYLKRFSLSLSSAAGIYSCFFLLLTYAVAPAMSAGRSLFGGLIARRHKAVIISLILTLPYVCYAAGTADFRWPAAGRLIAITAPSIFLYSLFPVHDEARFNWQDTLVAIYLALIVVFHLFKGIWNIPVNLDFMGRLLMVTLGVLSWTFVRAVPDLGYQLECSKIALLAAMKNFVLFAAIAIPLGLLLGFTSWNPRWHSLLDFVLSCLEIFLFVALLEELFFRGFLQNLLEKSLHSWWRGQLIASSIFGLFHILHKPFPNWRYVALASIAGWFYGAAYRAGGTLLSSALLHAIVDTVWRTFFTKV